MNYLVELDVDLHKQNSLDEILGLSPEPQNYTDQFQQLQNDCQQKQNCVTNYWIWNNQQSINQINKSLQNKSILEMKSARLQQQQKIKKFISNIKILSLTPNKITFDVNTDIGSPKKKKIKKLPTTTK